MLTGITGQKNSHDKVINQGGRATAECKGHVFMTRMNHQQGGPQLWSSMERVGLFKVRHCSRHIA